MERPLFFSRSLIVFSFANQIRHPRGPETECTSCEQAAALVSILLQPFFLRSLKPPPQERHKTTPLEGSKPGFPFPPDRFFSKSGRRPQRMTKHVTNFSSGMDFFLEPSLSRQPSDLRQRPRPFRSQIIGPPTELFPPPRNFIFPPDWKFHTSLWDSSPVECRSQ